MSSAATMRKLSCFVQDMMPVPLGFAGISTCIDGRNPAIGADSAALLSSLFPRCNHVLNLLDQRGNKPYKNI
jgi:hypothetical protein